MKWIAKVTLLTLATVATLNAVEAYQGEITFTQNDGTTFLGHLKGDEYFHWIEDKHGNLIVYNKKKQRYELGQVIEKEGQLDLNTTGIAVSSTQNKSFSAGINEGTAKVNSAVLRKIWQRKRREAAKRRAKMSEL